LSAMGMQVVVLPRWLCRVLANLGHSELQTLLRKGTTEELALCLDDDRLLKCRYVMMDDEVLECLMQVYKEKQIGRVRVFAATFLYASC